MNDANIIIADIIAKHIFLDNMLDSVIIQYFMPVKAEDSIAKNDQLKQFKKMLDDHLSINAKQKIFLDYIYDEEKHQDQITFTKYLKKNMSSLNHYRNIVAHGQLLKLISADKKTEYYQIIVGNEKHKLNKIREKYTQLYIEILSVISRYNKAMRFYSGTTPLDNMTS